MEQIRIRGARTHNLKNINLDLPRNKLIVITGLSGSGKSSLAFDTLYAEGQRRYVESLSAYARQFLQLMEKPDVDLIEGLSPAISIEQKATSHNPRSTVGTVTEIHDYLRLLYARVGTPYCPDHRTFRSQRKRVSQMVDAVLALPEETKLMILAPVVADRKGEHVELFEEMQAQGFVRFRVRAARTRRDLRSRRPAEAEEDREAHDRRRHRPPQGAAPTSSSAWPNLRDRAAPGRRPRAIALEMDTDKRTPSSPPSSPARSATTRCRNWSRACSRSTTRWAPARECDGLGHIEFFDPKRVVALPATCRSRPARSRAGTGATSSTSRCCRAWRAHYEFDIDTPFEELPETAQHVVLYGSGKRDDPVHLHQRARPRRDARAHVRRHHPEPGAALPRDRFDRGAARNWRSIINEQPCPDCDGARLRTRGAPRERRRRHAAARDLRSRRARRCATRLAFFEQLKLQGAKREIADQVVKEIVARLRS